MFRKIQKLYFVLPAALLFVCILPTLAADDAEKKPASEDGEIMAVVNGENIMRADLVKILLKRYGGPELQQLIVETLINQNKEKHGVSVTEEEVKEALKRAVDEEINAQRGQIEERGIKWETYLLYQKMTEENIRRDIREKLMKHDKEEGILTKKIIMSKLAWYDTLTRDRVDVEQIQVETEADAKVVLKLLKEGKEFSELAQDRMPDPRQRLLKEVSLGDYRIRMDIPGPEFELVALSTKKGQVSAPVKSDRGWHIIKVIERHDRKRGKYADLKDEVIKHLDDTRTAEFANLYLWRLLYDSKIENTSGLKVPLMDVLAERKKEFEGETAAEEDKEVEVKEGETADEEDKDEEVGGRKAGE